MGSLELGQEAIAAGVPEKFRPQQSGAEVGGSKNTYIHICIYICIHIRTYMCYGLYGVDKGLGPSKLKAHIQSQPLNHSG